MTVVSQTILIHRPPEAVYDLAWRPERATEWIVGMVATENVRPGDPTTGLDCRFDWTYRLLGFTYRGQNRIVEAERPLCLREESSGDLISTWAWRFELVDASTRVHLTVTYTPPMGWLGRLLDPILLRRLNQHALDQTLVNLKRLLEDWYPDRINKIYRICSFWPQGGRQIHRGYGNSSTTSPPPEQIVACC